jgi:hypothetical protein
VIFTSDPWNMNPSDVCMISESSTMSSSNAGSLQIMCCWGASPRSCLLPPPPAHACRLPTPASAESTRLLVEPRVAKAVGASQRVAAMVNENSEPTPSNERICRSPPRS